MTLLLEPTPTGPLTCPACWRRGRAPRGVVAVCYGGPRPDGMRRPGRQQADLFRRDGFREPPHPRTVCVPVEEMAL